MNEAFAVSELPTIVSLALQNAPKAFHWTVINTMCHYTSFSDEDDMERLFTAMKTIQPEKELYSNDQLIKESGAGKSVSVLLQKTREKVDAVG